MVAVVSEGEGAAIGVELWAKWNDGGQNARERVTMELAHHSASEMGPALKKLDTSINRSVL